MPLVIAIISLVYAAITSGNVPGNMLVFNTLGNIVNLSHGIWGLALPVIAVVAVISVIVWIAKGREFGMFTSGCGCYVIALVLFLAVGAWVTGFLGYLMLTSFSPELGVIDNTKFVVGLVIYVLLCWS